MGNSSSAPVNKERQRRRANRLSKPLTDPESSNLRRLSAAQRSETAAPSSPLARSERDSASNAEPPVDENLAIGHGVGPQIQSRPELQRRQSAQESESNIRSSLGSLVGGVPDRISRSKSALSHLPHSSPAAAEELHAADRSPLSFVPESEPVVWDSASQVAPEDWKETRHSPIVEIDQAISPSPDLLNDNQFTSGRRRSLQTPGIATRTSGGYGQNLRRTSVPKARSSYHSGNTHPSNDIAYQLRPQDTFPAHPRVASPQPRVSTPTQLEYRQLGGLKPGTLRITNGYPPATPNDQSQRNNLNQLSSEPLSGESRLKSRALPDEDESTLQPHPSPYRSDEENGLGLQFISRSNQRTPKLDHELHPANTDKRIGISLLDDEPSGNAVSDQYDSKETKGWLTTPTETFSSRFLDSPFSFEISPTPMTIPTINEFDDRSFEDEGVDISHTADYQEPDPEQSANGFEEDCITALRERTEQPLKKADSGYSSATSAHSKRTNSLQGRIGIDTSEKCDSYADKVANWNSSRSNEDHSRGGKRRCETTLPENDVISQPLRPSGSQLNTYHTSRSVFHLRETKDSARSRRPAPKQPVESESNRISFQNSFSTPHLPREEDGHGRAAPYPRSSSETPVPPVPVELTAQCGCVLRFNSLSDSHGIHTPEDTELPPRRESAPMPAFCSQETVQDIPQAPNMCTCGTPMPANPSHAPPTSTNPTKLTRRRRSSGARGMSGYSTNHVDSYSRETRLGSSSGCGSREWRLSSETPYMRRSVGTSSQLSRPKSFTSLGSRPPSDYREQPMASREPSLWEEDVSVYSDSTGFRGAWQSPYPDQDLIPPIPPLPTEIKPKKSISSQLGLSQNKASTADSRSQPRKLVKPQKGSSRHPRDSRLVVNGAF